jgi:hypothetical protein
MPRLDKHTNGSRPEQRDLLHATVRYSNIAQVASAKDKRPLHAAALQEPTKATNKDSLRNREGFYLAKISTLIYPSTLVADVVRQERQPSMPICEQPVKTPSRGRIKREKPDPFKHQLLAQFGFQPFKKCFYGKCTTIFVPGDFKPSSPRRMFCSTKCFEAHWRQKLFRYLEKNLAQEADMDTANSETPAAVSSYLSL